MAFSNMKDAHLARQIMALRYRKGLVKEYPETIMSIGLSDITVQANGIIPGIRREIVLTLLSEVLQSIFFIIFPLDHIIFYHATIFQPPQFPGSNPLTF